MAAISQRCDYGSELAAPMQAHLSPYQQGQAGGLCGSPGSFLQAEERVYDSGDNRQPLIRKEDAGENRAHAAHGGPDQIPCLSLWPRKQQGPGVKVLDHCLQDE